MHWNVRVDQTQSIYIIANWQLRRRVLSRSLSCRIIARLLRTWTVKISSSESWVRDEPDFKFQVSFSFIRFEEVLLRFSLLHNCRNRTPTFSIWRIQPTPSRSMSRLVQKNSCSWTSLRRPISNRTRNIILNRRIQISSSTQLIAIRNIMPTIWSSRVFQLNALSRLTIQWTLLTTYEWTCSKTGTRPISIRSKRMRRWLGAIAPGRSLLISKSSNSLKSEERLMPESVAD